MSVNITGIYDNTVIVDTNLFEDVRLLQTGLSSLSDTLFDVDQGLPYKQANLTAFSALSDNYDAIKITNNLNLSTIYSDTDNLTTNLSVLNVDINNNFVNNTTLPTLTNAIDNQFITTTTYIDEQIVEQHDYTDQEKEALRTEGYTRSINTIFRISQDIGYDIIYLLLILSGGSKIPNCI